MKHPPLLLFLVLLFMTSCQSNFAVKTTQLPQGTQSNQPAVELIPAQETKENDEITSSGLSMPVSPNENGSNSGTLLNEAEVMKLTFPTPMTGPVSLWRPPLYDTPWALSKYDHFYFSRPIAADQVNWPLPDYRYGGIIFDPDIVHTGIDIPAKRGTTVIAAGKGKVIWAGYGLFYGIGAENDPYGLAVSVEHDFGYKGQKLYTIYAHLDRIDVEIGQAVETGTPLGLVGLTGNTTGPHLHFEVRVEEDSFYKTRNPELWIAPPQGWGVLAGDFRNTNGSFLDHHLVSIRSLANGQKWEVYTYGSVTIHKDNYYQENMVISDLPAGDYEVEVEYFEETYTCQVEINPGVVSYIKFIGRNGYDFSGPPVDIVQNWPDQE